MSTAMFFVLIWTIGGFVFAVKTTPDKRSVLQCTIWFFASGPVAIGIGIWFAVKMYRAFEDLRRRRR